MSSSDHNLRTRFPGRCLGLVFLLATSLTVLTAQDRLTPATLTAWTASGTPPVAEISTGAITLPAGSQLFRSYPAGRVTVRLLSRPYFHAKSGNWPALEVGPAALTFVQDGAGGGMVLLGDKALTLPQTIALGTDGRSVRQLDLRLDYDGARNEVTLVMDGASYALASTSAGEPMAVAVSAGAEAAWTLDILEVTASPAVKSDDKSDTNSVANRGNAPSIGQKPVAPSAGTPPADAAARKRAFAEAAALFKAGDFAGAEKALFSTNRHPPGTLGWQLESAGKLTQMSLTLRQEYYPKVSVAVARRALEFLREGARLARTAAGGQRATIHEMAAFLHDELLRDESAARTEYQKAQQASPQSARTRDGLNRLNEARDKSQRLNRSQ